MQEQLEAIAAEIAANGYWQEGWIAVRYKLTRLGEEEKEDTEAVARLQDFESRLRPKNITQRVRAFILSGNHGALDYAESDDVDEPESPMAAHERAYVSAEELGKTVCGDQTVFTTLLPDVVRGDAARLFPFGKGLALASANHRKMWDQLTEAFVKTKESNRNGEALCGFLNGLFTIDQQLCEALLEDALTHHTLGAWFPGLQSSVTITIGGADRLKRAGRLGIAQPSAFRFLGWERPSGAVSAHDLQLIVMSLAKQEEGFRIATDILSARLHPDKDQQKEYPFELIDAGRELLSSPDFSVRDNSYDYHLQTIANVCLCGTEGSAAAELLCQRIKQALSDHTMHAYNYERLLLCIFLVQPRIALDVFFGGSPRTDDCDLFVDDFNFHSDRRKNPLDGVPVEEMLRWCDKKPAERYGAMSRVVSYHTAAREGGVEWTPLAIEMLKRAPDPLAVLKTFVRRFHPRSWSGSLAAIIESRLRLLDRLGEMKNESLEDYATEIRPQLVDEVFEWRKQEDERDSARDERFE